MHSVWVVKVHPVRVDDDDHGDDDVGGGDDDEVDDHYNEDDDDDQVRITYCRDAPSPGCQGLLSSQPQWLEPKNRKDCSYV